MTDIYFCHPHRGGGRRKDGKMQKAPSYVYKRCLNSIEEIIFYIETLTYHHPEKISDALNKLFEELSIPAKIVGWYDPLTNDHSKNYYSYDGSDVEEIKTSHYYLVKIDLDGRYFHE